jgi:hypothetical protein
VLKFFTDAVTKAGIRGVKVSFAYQNGNLKLATVKADKPLIKTTVWFPYI